MLVLFFVWVSSAVVRLALLFDFLHLEVLIVRAEVLLLLGQIQGAFQSTLASSCSGFAFRDGSVVLFPVQTLCVLIILI